MTRAELARRLKVYLVTDARLARGRDLREVVSAALAGGVTAVQLREKEASTLAQVELGRALRRLTREAGALLIVNDRVDVAVAIEADGVHLGQDDLPVDVARRILGPEAIVGGSAGNAAELAASLTAGVDYLGVGPIFPTGSKADAGAPIGLAGLAAIRAATSLPIVGIGALNATNVAAVIRSGADGAAVISAIVSAEDVRGAARQLRDAVEAALGDRP